MTKPKYFLAPITLLNPLPTDLPAPKFHIGQEVLWASTPTHGFGQIIGLVFADGVSVQQTGYHYAVQLDPQSPSSNDCVADWGFEEDLQLMATHAHLLKSVSATKTEVLS
jgi:hypothetical protein